MAIPCLPLHRYEPTGRAPRFITSNTNAIIGSPHTKFVKVWVAGGGGGGGSVFRGVSQPDGASNGGGAGAIIVAQLPALLNQILQINTNPGGAGGAFGNNAGAAGGTASLFHANSGANLVAGGGSGGAGGFGAAGGNGGSPVSTTVGTGTLITTSVGGNGGGGTSTNVGGGAGGAVGAVAGGTLGFVNNGSLMANIGGIYTPIDALGLDRTTQGRSNCSNATCPADCQAIGGSGAGGCGGFVGADCGQGATYGGGGGGSSQNRYVDRQPGGNGGDAFVVIQEMISTTAN